MNGITISLNNVKFRAYHGLFPEERQKGNDFVVNMQVSYDPKVVLIEKLEDTIDYSQLFQIIQQVMKDPVDLLETLVQKIAIEVRNKFPEVNAINVSVEKLNPPIDQFEGSTEVAFRWTS